MRGRADPYGNGVVIRGVALASEGQAGSCVPARAGAVLGLASASRQRLKTGMPLVGWAGWLGRRVRRPKWVRPGEFFSLSFLFSIFYFFAVCFDLV